jgi:hypothetical protein
LANHGIPRGFFLPSNIAASLGTSIGTASWRVIMNEVKDLFYTVTGTARHPKKQILRCCSG